MDSGPVPSPLAGEGEDEGGHPRALRVPAMSWGRGLAWFETCRRSNSRRAIASTWEEKAR